MSVSALLLLAIPLAQNADWAHYHGSPANTKFSPLKQIHTGNAAGLREAWRYDSGGSFPGSEIQCNPLVIGGVLYATSPALRVFALDAATGRELWTFDPFAGSPARGKQRNRGLMYAKGRIYFAAQHWLHALDARTGKPLAAFGVQGRVDLRRGLGRDPERLTITSTTPGVIHGNLMILGSLTSEDLPSAPGDIRAFDLDTGALTWSFHTIPRPGEPGHETWPPDAYTYTGGANSWSGLTLDAKRGIVYVPTGSASFDFYGANRHGDNLYANCLLALDAKTGKRLWHFQFVRHDVWDRDLPSAPTLLTVRRNGQEIDAVAQITKSGHVWVFNRATGESLFPFEDSPVPASDVEGEKLAAKQRLPLAPPPFSRQMVTGDMVRLPADQARLAKVRSGPQFTPPSTAGTVIFPGFDGGGEWGGASWDPETRLFYVNSNEMAWILRLVPRPAGRAAMRPSELYARNCAGCHGKERQGTPPEFPSLQNLKTPETRVKQVISQGAGRMPRYDHLGEEAIQGLTRWLLSGEDPPVKANTKDVAPGLKYYHDGYNRFLDAEGYPAITPPWGMLTAYDLDQGEIRWKQPFGTYPKLADKNTGSENYGGAVVTAGGLLFIGATNFDKKFHVFDKRTGTLLWETEMPAGGNATPATYMVNGKQYVVIAAGGGKSGAPSSSVYVAYALPDSGR
jgi:quinoprotein glucose dehydrogenase